MRRYQMRCEVANIEFSINDCVKVKLTDFGLQILEQQHDELYARLPVKTKRAWNPPAVDADGYSQFQLWILMNSFGAYLDLGAVNLPFETEIAFVVLPKHGLVGCGSAKITDHEINLE